MRFIQRGEKSLEVHNNKVLIPVPLTTAGLGLLILGLLVFFKGTIVCYSLGALLCFLGISIIINTIIQVSKYRYYVFTYPDEQLWERNLFGTYKVNLEPGGISNVQLSVTMAEDLSAIYEVSINYSSGKSYVMEVTKDEGQADAIADIFSFYFDKNLVKKVPNLPDAELDTDRFNDSMYTRLKLQYPQGMPRREPPAYDYLIIEKTKYRNQLKLTHPARSLIFHNAIYIFLLSIFTCISIIILYPKYIVYGIVVLLLGLLNYFIMSSIEAGNFEDIVLTPEEIKYHRHYLTSEIKYEVPMEELKFIRILSCSGYKLQKLNIFGKGPEIHIKKIGGDTECVEFYLLTDRAIIGIESWMNREMADYLKHSIENAVYVLCQKSEREAKGN